MPRHASQYLRFAAILAASVMLSACAHHKPGCATVAGGDEIWCAPTDQGDMWCFRAPKGAPICPIEYNIVQCFFYDVHFQGAESDAQRLEVKRALTDALELPIEELREKRYADFRMEPNKWTLDRIISTYFMGRALIRGHGYVSSGYKGFYPALKLPETEPVLRHWIGVVEKSIGIGGIEDE